MIEKIVHTAKHTVKAIVDIANARDDASSGLVLTGSGLVMVGSVERPGAPRFVDRQNKKATSQITRPSIGNRVNLSGSFALGRPSLDAIFVVSRPVNNKAGTVPVCLESKKNL
jgi:hypothetical protein